PASTTTRSVRSPTGSTRSSSASAPRSPATDGSGSSPPRAPASTGRRAPTTPPQAASRSPGPPLPVDSRSTSRSPTGSRRRSSSPTGSAPPSQARADRSRSRELSGASGPIGSAAGPQPDAPSPTYAHPTSTGGGEARRLASGPMPCRLQEAMMSSTSRTPSPDHPFRGAHVSAPAEAGSSGGTVGNGPAPGRAGSGALARLFTMLY